MPRAVDKAYSTIRERILKGVYPPAMHLTEQEVSNVAGVSRTPAREALRRLQAEGFVAVTPNYGAVIASWTEEDIDSIYELRSMLEPYGAARAAHRITEAEVVQIRSLAQEQYGLSKSPSRENLSRIGQINGQFHRMLHHIAASRHLTTALSSLIEAPLMLRTFSLYRPEDLTRSALHHMELVDALEARDADWAASVMRTHVLAARAALRRR